MRSAEPRTVGARVLSALVLAAVASACAASARGPAVAVASSRPHPDAGASPVALDADGGLDEADDTNASDEPQREPAGGEGEGPCPRNMALVPTRAGGSGAFCIDVYEAALVETSADGSERPYPHYLPVDGHDVRAVSEAGVFPQAYISELQAQDACAASGKRLCSYDEWKTACMGPTRTTFPYGDARRPGACHDSGRSPVVAVFGAKAVAASAVPARPASRTARKPDPKQAHVVKKRAAASTYTRATPRGTKPADAARKIAATRASTRKPARASTRPASVDPGVWAKLNEPALGQVEGAVARTAEHAECVNAWGVFDMVGNLHEWVATDARAAHGTFAGGYFLDTSLNGDGCNYRTVAHAHDYHDYSTGFRCCADAAAR